MNNVLRKDHIWRRWLVIVAIVLLYTCAMQGMRPLYSPDEGRYTNVALIMLDTGDWLHPMLHPEVQHWSKPPLTYWSIAASLAVFGHSEFAARLPGALAFAGVILLILRLGRRLVPDQPWLPALIYATFLFPPIASNLVTTDGLLNFFVTLQGVMFVEMWWADSPQAARRARRWLWVAAGLAFLTKGPPGLLVLAACLLFAAWSEGWRGLRRVFAWDALALFLAFGFSWYAIVVWQEPSVLRYFLVEEVVDRITSDSLHRNGSWYGGIKIYLPTFLIGALPWTPVLLRALWRHRRDALAKVRENPQLRLLACWLLLPLTVFMLARSRLPLYILPLFVPLAVLAARQLAPFAMTPKWRMLLIGVWCLVLVAARAAPAWMNVANDDRRLAAGLREQMTQAPGEVAFVDTAPRYGLHFYLGTQIERLHLPDAPAAPQSQDLMSEVEEKEGCRVLLAKPDQLADLKQTLVAQRIGYVRLRDTRGYVVLAQRSADCAEYPLSSQR